MKSKEEQGGMYRFGYLPQYATFILEFHLDDFVQEQLRLSRPFPVALLQHVKQRTSEEMVLQVKQVSADLLHFLAANRAQEFIETSVPQWISEQIAVLGKFQVTGEDIAFIHYIRQEALRLFLPEYTNDLSLALSLVREINAFMAGSTASATSTYIQILKSQIDDEAHFSSNVVSASPGITYIYDLVQHKSLYVTGKVEEMMGYTPEEVLRIKGNAMMELGHPEDLQRMAGGLHQMVVENSDRTFTAEFRLRDKRGVYRWLRSYLVVFKRNEQGMPVEVLGQLYEITKEKELIKALEKRESQLLEAQSLARLGSFDWDFATSTAEYTPELKEILEMEAPQAIEEVMERIHPEDREKVKESLETALQSGLYECEYRYRTAAREKVLWAKGIVAYEEGRPIRMIGTVQDITERKRIEESLREKTIALEKANTGLQEFASVASHDLKEPLRKIITFTDLVRASAGHLLTEQDHFYLQRTMDSASRMKALIDDVLAYSALSGPEQKEKVSLYQLVREVLASLELQIKEKAAAIKLSRLPEAKVYPMQMIQLFQNLLSNALKFAKAHEPLQIEINYSFKSPAQVNGYPIQKASQYLEIQVADNGIGFPQEAAEKIFLLFNRLHSKSTFEGTGVGLAICRRVAENHGGIVYADSKPGIGSVFTVLLPLE